MRFVLVQGGFHGAWCWSRTIDELQRLGQDAIAVDLPGHGARQDEAEATTFAGRLDAVVSVLEPGDVLVGHSGGGFDITMAANAAPDLVGHVTYLAAALPREGRTWPEAMATQADGTMGDFDVAGMLQDRAMPQWLSDLVADRLGVEQLTIDTSHSPFLSRPAELAELLVHAATTTPIGPLRPD